jgi:glycosyltransferase involved in cell wall biosynthesis
MKILYLNYLYDIYGASLGSAIKPMMLFSEIEKLGHEVRFCWMKDQPRQQAGTRAKIRKGFKNALAKYLHEPKQFLSNFGNAQRELHLMRLFKPDVVVARLDVSLFSALSLAKAMRIPFVLEADCPVHYESLTFRPQYLRLKSASRFLESVNVAHADAVVVVSTIMRDYFAQYRVDPERIFIVPNAVDIHRFNGTLADIHVREKFGLDGKIVLGFVGALSYWHGVETLMELIPLLLAKFDTIAFLLVGAGGKREPQMREFVRDNGLQDRIVMTGYVPYEDIPAYLAAMDIVLAPYPKLDFFYYSPVKLYEYMASERPLVAPALGQIAEVITDGVNGVLTRPGDVTDMVAKVEHLIKDTELRRRMGAAARKTMIQQHTWRHRAEKWMSIFQFAIDRVRE